MSGILACANVLGILGMGLLVMIITCRRRSVWRVHVTCLSGGGLELTDGVRWKRVVYGVVVCGPGVDRRVVLVVVLVLVMRGSKAWWRVDVDDGGMTLWGRDVGIVMLLVMLSSFVVRHGLISMLLVVQRRLIVVCRHGSRAQGQLRGHGRIADVLLRQSCLQVCDVVSQSEVLVLDRLEVGLHGQILLEIILQLVDVLLLAQAEGALGGAVLSSALRVRKFALGSSLLAGSSSLGVGVGGG